MDLKVTLCASLCSCLIKALQLYLVIAILMLTVNLMSAQWKPGKEVHQWKVSRPCEVFEKKYDSLTEKITKLSSMDDLLSGIFCINYRDPSAYYSIFC